MRRAFAKEQAPEPLEAEPGLLQGEQQPKIPLEHLVQHAPIGGGQGIACEPCATPRRLRGSSEPRRVAPSWATPLNQHHRQQMRMR